MYETRLNNLWSPWRATFSLLAGLLIWSTDASAQYGTAHIVTENSSGVAGDGASLRCALSSDGRYLAFESTAANLASGSSSGVSQILVLDRTLHNYEIASASSAPDNFPGDDNSIRPSISSDGRYVAFSSDARNITTDDNDGYRDIFRRDRTAKLTDLVSYTPTHAESTSNDAQYCAISGDGLSVAFESASRYLVASPSDSSDFIDLFLGHPGTGGGGTELISLTTNNVVPEAASDYGVPALSSDGRYVVFGTRSSTLFNSDTNAVADVVLRDRTNNTTEQISLMPGGGVFSFSARALGPNSISADGRYVLFIVESAPPQLYLRDRTAATTTLLSATSEGNAANGATSSAVISADGAYVAFQSSASDILSSAPLGGVFLKNLSTGEVTYIDGEGSAPCINGDGTVVIYNRYDTTSQKNQLYIRRTDLCPSSDTKDEPGACGCDNAETPDSDGDGYPDCIDSCKADANKTEPGSCGCGVADNDDNGNGALDCKERWFKPRAARVHVVKRSVLMTLQSWTKARYQVSLTYKRRTSVKTFTKNRVTIRKLKKGSYTFTYKIIDLTGATPVTGGASRAQKFKVR